MPDPSPDPPSGKRQAVSALLTDERLVPYTGTLPQETRERLDRAILGFQEAAQLLRVARAAGERCLFLDLVAEADDAVLRAAGALSDVAWWSGVVLLRD